jgi:short-subunit dehydrogenase
MPIKLKRINEQVIVITGATSGIGLTTARMAAEQGAKLVLAARNGDALDVLASELRKRGTQVVTVAADVGEPADVARIGQAAIERFGRIDTWINNAGISIYGRSETVAPEDQQRLFKTNFWGVVNGSHEALKHIKGRGGALINLGSETSDAPVPLQAMYTASKHAVKGFTDSLRIELENEQAPVSVTLIKPAGIDTMFGVHAKNYLEKEPRPSPPLYAPELVAKAILYAAQHPKRDVFVGGAAKMHALSAYYIPRITDKLLSKAGFKLQKLDTPRLAGRRDALHAPNPGTELRQRQGGIGKVHEHCPYTAVSLRSRPIASALVGAGALFAAWSLTRRAAR